MVPLVDSFGRHVRDLRLSVTDRCNLRCLYCMPEDGLTWLPRDDILTYEELARVARLCVERWGFDGIRVTGGEPTVRAGLEELLALLRPLGVDLALTTNGIRLRELARPLAAAGLDRVNVSLDTLCPDTFRRLARRDGLERVLDGIDAALEAGLTPVKLNAVVIRGVNDDEIVDLATYGRERGVDVRFIEFMPLDADAAWSNEQVVPAQEIVERITEVFPAAPASWPGAAQPAAAYRYLDGRGGFGVIASVSEPFCDDCDRVRVTADGKFRTCLFALDEIDLRPVLREGGTDDDLAEVIRRAVAAKWAGHRIGQVDFIRPPRTMHQIGG